MFEQPFLIPDTGAWTSVKDGNHTARLIFDRHYSRRKFMAGYAPAKIIGPGQYMALISPDARAVFVWRKFIDDCRDVRSGTRQTGLNCAVFRNEGSTVSSQLIRAADALADADPRWHGLRHYTYVDPACIESRNPGYCFIRAGWRRCGRTARGLHILERPWDA